MLLKETLAALEDQLDQQDELGIQITARNDVPETGPANRGEWYSIPNVAVVFADLKASTHLNSIASPKTAARAYTHFVKAMVVILNRFDVRYVDIHGDGIFGLFSGQGALFSAFASAVTMKTAMERELRPRFADYKPADWDYKAGFGMDVGSLLVRQLGLRSEKNNEVWAGKPVNIASKLSSTAQDDDLVVSPRVYQRFEEAKAIRKRAILWSCGCQSGVTGDGLDLDGTLTSPLWEKVIAPSDIGLDFDVVHRLGSSWCQIHGPEFCEAIVTGKRVED